MNAAIPRQSFFAALPTPSGCYTVWRSRTRSHLRRSVIAGVLLGIAIPLACTLAAPIAAIFVYRMGDFGAGDCQQDYAMALVLTAAVLSVSAAILGSAATPSFSEFDTVQASLVTRLNSAEICLGRLAAGLTTPIAAIFVSALFWIVAIPLSVERMYQPTVSEWVACAYIFIPVLTVTAGSIAFLWTMRPRGKSSLLAGLSSSIGTLTACTLLVQLIDPVLLRMDNPVKLIEASLAINPAICIASAFHLDMLRNGLIYASTSAHDFPFEYPPVALTCAIYLGAFFVVMALAAVRMNRIYRQR